MLQKSLILALAAVAGAPAFASNYYVVVPVAGKTVNASAIQVSLASAGLPAGQVGQPYSYDFKPNLQVAGDPGYTGYGVSWSVAQGSLPAGLSLNRTTGVLSGTPTAGGVSSFTVNASYMTKAGVQTFQVSVIHVVVTLAGGAPPKAQVGQAYVYDLTPLLSVSGDPAFNASGVTWSVVTSSLPAGLSLSPRGVISGTPTAGGTGSVTARATYKSVTGEQGYQVLALDIQVSLADGTPPQATVGDAYSYDLKPLLSVTGDDSYDASVVQWSAQGTLPAGLTLSSSAGTVSGTPSAAGSQAVAIQALYKNVAATKSLTFAVQPAHNLQQFSGYIGWADGTYAQTCNGYRNPTDGHIYSGATGDGVYRIKPTGGAPIDAYCNMTTNGGGWTLVRRALPGAWHPVNDNASGTAAAYGAYTPNPRANAIFSLSYASFPFTDMLFATGDGVKWVAARKTSVSTITETCGTQVPVLASHISATPYSVAWCLRTAQPEDPWISVYDHGSFGTTAASDTDTMSMLYGESVVNGATGWMYWLNNRNGADVFIR